MRSSAVFLFLLVSGHLVAQEGAPASSVQAVCPAITAAIAGAVDSSAPIRVMRQPGMLRPALDHGAPDVRAERLRMLVASLQVPKAAMQRLLAAGSNVESRGEIPDCGQDLPRITWRGEPTAQTSDTVTINVSLPVFTQNRWHALIYLEQVVRPPWDGTLSGGERGSGSLYLLERRADRWAVIRTAGVWARLGQ